MYYFRRLPTSIPDGKAPLGENESFGRSSSDSSVDAPATNK